MRPNLKKHTQLFKMIWAASKRDLLMAVPWFPIYSLSEVCLAIGSAALLQLIFVTTQTVSLSSLIPGNFKDLITTPYAFDRDEIVFLIPIFIAIVALIKLISRFMSTYLTERAGHNTSRFLREQMLTTFLSSTGNTIDNVNPDKLANQLIQDTALLQSAVNKGTMSAIRDVFVLAGVVFALIFISWKVFFLALLVIVPMGMLLRQISKKLNFYTHEGQKKQINIATRFLQTHRDSLVINGLRSHEREREDLDDLNQDNYKFMRKSLFVRTFFSPMMEFIGILFIAIVFFVRVNASSDFHAENYSAMIILVVFAFRYIKNIASTLTFLSDLHVVMDRVTEYFQNYRPAVRNEHRTFLPSYSPYAVVADHVSCMVNTKTILDDCSVKILKGQKVAFIGESGAGKTSFLRVLAGLLIPTSGRFSICENSLMAFQSPYVFRGSVQENIVYNQAPESTQRVDEKCHDLVLALSLAFTESGAQIFLNKKLSFLGDGLSGGEKARVALARILFASPKLIFLDEPTANLDAVSSNFFWNAIDRWKSRDSEHTVLAVSHAMHDVMDFDYCFVFEHGRIVRQGVPREILK